MTAGAVILTDFVYWCIIFPFLTAQDYKLSFVSTSWLLSYLVGFSTSIQFIMWHDPTFKFIVYISDWPRITLCTLHSKAIYIFYTLTKWLCVWFRVKSRIWLSSSNLSFFNQVEASLKFTESKICARIRLLY